MLLGPMLPADTVALSGEVRSVCGAGCRHNKLWQANYNDKVNAAGQGRRGVHWPAVLLGPTLGYPISHQCCDVQQRVHLILSVSRLHFAFCPTCPALPCVPVVDEMFTMLLWCVATAVQKRTNGAPRAITAGSALADAVRHLA